MKKICLTEKELAIVKEIFQGYEHIVLFGSRIIGTCKKFSDLDVCLMNPIPGYEYEILKEKFENSDLPFKVDLIEYNRLDDYFKKHVDQEGVPLSEF